VLVDMTLTVGPGEQVALVGSTGSGKSTLLRLAAGLIGAQAGTARLAGTQVAQLRRTGDPTVLLFPQRSYAVHGSVLDNVRLWCPTATRDEVRRVAGELGFEEWLCGLPGGLETPVGFGGSELTGADRQRLALLGLLLTEPRPVAVDEPTSLLPAPEQARVLTALRRRFARFPLLIASHHQETARRCDRVAFLADGRLVDAGTHDQLAGRCPAYRRLWTNEAEGALA
jgi:ATP-binding cassette subfamily B protein